MTVGQREIDNFNRNAADFMARFGTTDKCRCAQCVKVRREGVIEGLREALEIVGAHSTVETPEAIERDIRAEIERLKGES